VEKETRLTSPSPYQPLFSIRNPLLPKCKLAMHSFHIRVFAAVTRRKFPSLVLSDDFPRKIGAKLYGPVPLGDSHYQVLPQEEVGVSELLY
jgi:hypothetical protein